MENKKTKLTISGGPKKSFKNIDSVNNQDCQFKGDTVSRESWFQGYRIGS